MPSTNLSTCSKFSLPSDCVRSPSAIVRVVFAAGHSTSDDPARYRPADEAARWPLGDPIERLKQHLIGLGEWSEERHAEQATALQEEVRTANAQAQGHGILSDGPHHEAGTMFEDVFKEMPWHLREQRAELERFNAGAEEEGA